MDNWHARKYSIKVKKPTFTHERELAAAGHLVIGVDEVGCGCLAGPVVAAAVHLPLHSRMSDIHDSKLLNATQREKIFSEFIQRGFLWTIGVATVAEVDKINVRKASYLAMKRAIDLFEGATFALVDAWKLPGILIPQRGIIHGDRLVKSIAAASIVAKVARDRLMVEYHKDFPQYSFDQHKGYGTLLHRKLLAQHGPCELHRATFLKKMGIGGML